MLINPFIAFIISLTLLIVLILVNVEVALAVTLSTIMFGVLVSGINAVHVMANGMLNITTLNLILALVLALLPAYMMNYIVS